MIVQQQAAVYNGFEMCIEATLDAHCRHYFASPSPMHSLLLNEGLVRYQRRHGTCLQTQTPVEALAMAQGVGQLGDVPLVSSNYTDFLSVQHLLHHFFQEEIPCVYAVVLFHPPEFAGASLLPYGFACLQNAWPGSGFPLLHLMPSHLSQMQKNVQQAFALARRFQQPVLLLLDPMLLSTTQNVQSENFEPQKFDAVLTTPSGANTLRRARQRHQHMQQLAPQFLRRWIPARHPEFGVLAAGALGGWLLGMEWHENAVLVPDTLYPGVLNELQTLLQGAPLYVLEFAPGCLSEQLQQHYDYDFVSLKLPWERSAPVGLQPMIYAEIAASQRRHHDL